jgi:hypothetical protein
MLTCIGRISETSVGHNMPLTTRSAKKQVCGWFFVYSFISHHTHTHSLTHTRTHTYTHTHTHTHAHTHTHTHTQVHNTPVCPPSVTAAVVKVVRGGGGGGGVELPVLFADEFRTSGEGVVGGEADEVYAEHAARALSLSLDDARIRTSRTIDE